MNFLQSATYFLGSLLQWSEKTAYETRIQGLIQDLNKTQELLALQNYSTVMWMMTIPDEGRTWLEYLDNWIKFCHQREDESNPNHKTYGISRQILSITVVNVLRFIQYGRIIEQWISVEGDTPVAAGRFSMKPNEVAREVLQRYCSEIHYDEFTLLQGILSLMEIYFEVEDDRNISIFYPTEQDLSTGGWTSFLTTIDTILQAE